MINRAKVNRRIIRTTRLAFRREIHLSKFSQSLLIDNKRRAFSVPITGRSKSSKVSSQIKS